MDEYRDRVFAWMDATLLRWATLDARHSLDVALDISGEDDPFEGANVDHLRMIINEWFCEQGRP